MGMLRLSGIVLIGLAATAAPVLSQEADPGFEIDRKTFKEAAYCAGTLSAVAERAEQERHPNLEAINKEIFEFARYWRGPPARRVYDAEAGQEWFNAGQVAMRSYLSAGNDEAIDQIGERCGSLQDSLVAEEEHVRLVGEAEMAKKEGRVGPCVDPSAEGAGSSIEEAGGDLIVKMDPCSDVDAMAAELQAAIERGLAVGDPFKNEAPPEEDAAEGATPGGAGPAPMISPPPSSDPSALPGSDAMEKPAMAGEAMPMGEAKEPMEPKAGNDGSGLRRALPSVDLRRKTAVDGAADGRESSGGS